MVSVQDERGADEQGDEQDPVVRAVAREDRAQELANRRERLLRFYYSDNKQALQDGSNTRKEY